MSPGEPYAVEFTPTADTQIRKPFPDAAFDALYAVLGAISRDPWGHTVADTTEESEAFRWAGFGGAGWVFVYVDEPRRTVRVHNVTWLG